jgi:hypothetical protein
MSVKILLIILIGKKLANKDVKVSIYANFQTICALLKKNRGAFLKHKR